ncbi:MAG: hypothetical protein Q9227_001819 [Pyrenula ochraceoflavens]
MIRFPPTRINLTDRDIEEVLEKCRLRLKLIQDGFTSQQIADFLEHRAFTTATADTTTRRNCSAHKRNPVQRLENPGFGAPSTISTPSPTRSPSGSESPELPSPGAAQSRRLTFRHATVRQSSLLRFAQSAASNSSPATVSDASNIPCPSNIRYDEDGQKSGRPHSQDNSRDLVKKSIVGDRESSSGSSQKSRSKDTATVDDTDGLAESEDSDTLRSDDEYSEDSSFVANGLASIDAHEQLAAAIYNMHLSSQDVVGRGLQSLENIPSSPPQAAITSRQHGDPTTPSLAPAQDISDTAPPRSILTPAQQGNPPTPTPAPRRFHPAIPNLTLPPPSSFHPPRTAPVTHNPAGPNTVPAQTPSHYRTRHFGVYDDRLPPSTQPPPLAQPSAVKSTLIIIPTRRKPVPVV